MNLFTCGVRTTNQARGFFRLACGYEQGGDPFQGKDRSAGVSILVKILKGFGQSIVTFHKIAIK